VVFVNRVGVDESLSFWGGSEVVGPSGSSVYRAPMHEDGLFEAIIDPAELRHERIATPLLRDERPEIVLRQLDRITRSRAGEPIEDEVHP
jgi:predicted amidohydrolase